jgi:acyl carrier protein
MKITKNDFLELLKELFDIPTNSEDSLDLIDYIKDSIDVGELLSILKIRYNIDIEPNELRSKTKLGDVWLLIQSKK